MAVNCQRCGTQFGVTEWFCSFCGKERPMCPDCGAEMDEEKCKNCGAPRKAPCGECGLMIDGTAEECPHCDYNESEEMKKKMASRKKKALAFGVAGIVGFFIVSSVVPGPSIIGTAVGALVALPLLFMGGMTGFYYNRKESKSEDLVAADLSKGREQNKTKEWREMEREQRKAMLNAAAEGAKVAGKAAETYAKKKDLDEKREAAKEEIEKGVELQQEGAGMLEKGEEMMQTAEQKEQSAHQKEQRANEKLEKTQADVPDVCPRCKEKWRGSGGVLGSQNYKELASGRFQCTECGETVNLS